MATDTVELLKALVAIDSVNPSLVAGGAGEREIAAFVVDWARGCGLNAELLERTPGRPSVVVKAHGSGDGAHGAEEWVSVSATDAVAEVLIEVAERVCG